MRTICLLLLLTCTTRLSTSNNPSADDSAYAFVNVTVIPMDTERTLPHHTVVVREGRITEIKPASEIELDEDVVQIDGTDRFLIPGLIDMHAHLLSDDRIAKSYAEEELKVMLANGVTTARLMIGTPAHLDYRTQITTSALIGPRLFVASPQLAGRAFGDPFNGYPVTTPEAARMAVRKAKQDGYDFIKITFWISRPVYDAIIETAEAVDLPVIGHIGPDVGLERALEAGQQIEHLDEYLEALLPDDAPVPGGVSGVGIWRPDHWPSLDHLDEDRIPELARRTAEAGVWNTPTLAFLHSSFGTGRTDEEIETSPDIRFVSSEVRDELLSNRSRYWSDPPEAERRVRFVEVRNRLTRALYDAGANLMAGSDSPEWLLLYGFTLHRELEYLAEAGLPPYAVLEAATRNPAEWLGGLDEFGTIEPGKHAELVLLSANPLDDISNTQAITGVMSQGRWMPKTDLQRMLDDAAQILREAPLRE